MLVFLFSYQPEDFTRVITIELVRFHKATELSLRPTARTLSTCINCMLHQMRNRIILQKAHSVRIPSRSRHPEPSDQTSLISGLIPISLLNWTQHHHSTPI